MPRTGAEGRKVVFPRVMGDVVGASQAYSNKTIRVQVLISANFKHEGFGGGERLRRVRLAEAHPSRTSTPRRIVVSCQAISTIITFPAN